MRNGRKETGIRVCEVLAIVFIVLQLLCIIDWSRVCELSPAWFPLIIVLVLYVIIAICDN